jgi:uncharacterized protein YndB with AHSA1/START domain
VGPAGLPRAGLRARPARRWQRELRADRRGQRPPRRLLAAALARPPRRLEFEDGFADEHGRPEGALPATVVRVALAEAGTGTEMGIVFTFPSREAMEQMLARGFEAGLTGSVGQIDALLAA